MKINNIKINGFGKLENKEFSFNKGINLVMGNNESGKSTFAKCIQAILYGISRNKNGNLISDYEKYTPWNSNTFSAKINYSLDNGEQFEVYRDFSKRTTKIFNSNYEDISSNYSIDKSRNSNYFSEQTNISEDIFSRTAIVPQQEVRLNKLDQNVILQKISNLISTGDDTVSFKLIMDKLNKKQLNEVGTNRSIERPLNIVLNKIENCNAKLKDIENIKDKDNNLKNEIAKIKSELKEKENEIEMLKELQNIRNNERIDKSRIDAICKIISEYELDKEIENIKNKNSKNKKTGKKLILINIIYIFIIALFFTNIIPVTISLPVTIILSIIAIVLLFISIYFLFKRTPIPNTKSIFETAKLEKEQEVNKLTQKFENIKLSRNDYIRAKYQNTIFLNMSYEDISQKLENAEQEYSVKKLQYNTLSIDSKNIGNKMEELANVEEELELLNEQLANLNFINNSINIAKEALNEAYEEMKNSITPEFTNYLSQTIAKISGNKYSKIIFNGENGLTVELSNGDYINPELLSIGTIDQMYISLRLATLKEISKENIPIIFDETFVYFDDTRLKNILDFISKEFEQSIIFTCSKREKKLLENLNITYTEHIIN